MASKTPTTPAAELTPIKLEDLGERASKARVLMPLLRQILVGYQANLRRATASTLTRGKVSGGGKKPWRQKGTGRARVGSSRTPVWRGGGIVFGPTPDRNYTKVMTKSAKLQALTSALTLKIKAGSVHSVTLESAPTKTKMAVGLLGAAASGRKFVVVVPEMSFATSFSNIPGCYVFTASQLTAGNIIPAHSIIFVNGAWDTLKTKLA